MAIVGKAWAGFGRGTLAVAPRITKDAMAVELCITPSGLLAATPVGTPIGDSSDIDLDNEPNHIVLEFTNAAGVDALIEHLMWIRHTLEPAYRYLEEHEPLQPGDEYFTGGVWTPVREDDYSARAQLYTQFGTMVRRPLV